MVCLCRHLAEPPNEYQSLTLCGENSMWDGGAIKENQSASGRSDVDERFVFACIRAMSRTPEDSELATIGRRVPIVVGEEEEK